MFSVIIKFPTIIRKCLEEDRLFGRSLFVMSDNYCIFTAKSDDMGMKKLFDRLCMRLCKRNDEALRERCVKYAGGNVARAIVLFRYIKDGTLKDYNPKTNVQETYPTYP